jgi:tryptophanyl-tRNA synthetase
MVALNYFVNMGELSRQTQFKGKTQNGSYDKNNVGLFEYPVLMAADILAFDANMVPVGDDQKQHVELARDIANRFNHKTNSSIMTVPKTVLPLHGARVRSLSNPLVKMSKSESSKSYILLEDPIDSINAKIQSAVTDSIASIKYDYINQPGISNLLDIYHSFSGQKIESIVSMYSSDISYKRFKDDLVQVIVSKLRTLQNNYDQYNDRTYIDSILKRNKEKLNVLANKKLDIIYGALGVVHNA